MRPVSHVCLLEDGEAWTAADVEGLELGFLVSLDEFLGFGSERQVGEDDIGASLEEETCEFEVDACQMWLHLVSWEDKRSWWVL